MKGFPLDLVGTEFLISTIISCYMLFMLFFPTAAAGRRALPQMNNMRKFYLAYPICQNISDKLNWSQICELITISDPLERSFYEKECVHGNWDVVSLRRQMDSGLFLRLAASKDKKGILALAEHGVEVQRPDLEIMN